MANGLELLLSGRSRGRHSAVTRGRIALVSMSEKSKKTMRYRMVAIVVDSPDQRIALTGVIRPECKTFRTP